MTEHQPLDTTPRPAKLRVEDFLLLDRSGAFDAYAKAELIEGELFCMNAQFRRHAAMRRRLVRRLEDALAARTDGLGVADECNVAFDDATMPQPDITITVEPDGDGPIPLASVRLIVEIADTTLERDLGTKRKLYARYGVPEYWVLDLNGRVIHQMWSPAPDGYAERRESAMGEPVRAVTIAGLADETQGV